MWPPEGEYGPEFMMRVLAGLVPGSKRAFNFGQFAGVTSGNVPQDLWTQGGTYPWLTAGTPLKVRSTSPQDAPGGSGAQSIRCAFLDDVTYAERFQAATLNGTNDVNIAAAVNPIRINFVTCVAPGVANANATNVGNIEIRRQDNDAIVAIIPAGKGMTRQSQYTTPGGFTLIMAGWDIAVNALSGGAATRTADVEPFFRAPGEVFRQPRIISAADGNPTTLFLRTFAMLPEKNDMQFRCTSVSSSSSTAVSAAWEGILIPKPTP